MNILILLPGPDLLKPGARNFKKKNHVLKPDLPRKAAKGKDLIKITLNFFWGCERLNIFAQHLSGLSAAKSPLLVPHAAAPASIRSHSTSGNLLSRATILYQRLCVSATHFA